MSSTSQASALCNQLLGFARVQLNCLLAQRGEEQLNAFQSRAVKHAMISQLAAALVAYLDEIEFDLGPYPRLQGLPVENTVRKMHAQTQDFRGREIENLLLAGSKQNWLLLLLFLYEDTKTIADKKRLASQATEPNSQDNSIIAVQSNDEAAVWWEYSNDDLAGILESMQSLIKRHRDYSVEE